jgi:hypothetical protein
MTSLVALIITIACLQSSTQAVELSNKRQAPQNYTVDPTEHVLDPRGGTYPRMTRLADGSLLVSSERVQDGQAIIQVSKSTDDGKTFTAWGEVTRTPTTSKDLGNGYLIEVPGSPTPTVLCAFRNHDTGDFYRITLTKSTDGGKTWSFLTQVAQQRVDPNRKNGLWEPFIRFGADGNLQMTWSQELADNDQETFRSISSDGGATWSPPQNLRVHNPSVKVRDGMQGIVSVKDRVTGRDTLVMVFESNPAAETATGGKFRVEYALSYDDGATYSARGVVWQSGPGKNAGAPQIEKFSVDDSLVVSFMTDEDVPSGEQDWPSVATVKTVFAPLGVSDGKIDFRDEVLVGPRNSHWAGLWALDETRVMVSYENGPKLVGKVINREE